MIAADETFDGTFPYKPHFTKRSGFLMHYVDEGKGEPIVFLHGEPTWGYLYRRFIPPLSRHYRVIVPDHMGFGKSETPQDRPYTLRTHTENLTALMEELDLRDITLVIQDWGGSIGQSFAVRHPDRVKRLFLMNARAIYGDTWLKGLKDVPNDSHPLLSSEWFTWFGQGLETGRSRAVLSNLGSTVLSVMKIIGFERSEVITDTWIRAYSAPFESPEECVGAFEFPYNVYTGGHLDYIAEGSVGAEELRRKPAILAEGMEDKAIPPERTIADFRSFWPDAPVVQLPGVGHFCQEDAPETLIALIHQFIQFNP